MNTIYKRIYQHNDFLKKKFSTVSFFIKVLTIQKGGFSIEYKDKKIKFDSMIDNDRINIFLTSLKDSREHCIMIIIDKSEKIAYIESISNDKTNNCFDTPEFNKGFAVMEMTIKMLKKYKDKLNIKVIQLKDNSFIYCNNKIQIWLSSLSFLQYGDTFYGRFEFLPENKDNIKLYTRNQVILKQTKTSQINLNKIIEDFKGKIKNEVSIMKNYLKYKNVNIHKWFNKISHKYLLEDCDFFNHLINNIFRDLKLEKFIQVTFILQL